MSLAAHTFSFQRTLLASYTAHVAQA